MARDKQAAAAAAARSERARANSAELAPAEVAAVAEPVERRLELPIRELHRAWTDKRFPRPILVRALRWEMPALRVAQAAAELP